MSTFLSLSIAVAWCSSYNKQAQRAEILQKCRRHCAKESHLHGYQPRRLDWYKHASEAPSPVERKVQRLQQRRQWQALPRWQRLRPVFMHWSVGHYEAGGWRSALKDLWVSRENAPEDRL